MSDDRKKYAYNYYIKKGVPPIQAAAIVGNLVKESNLDTSIKGTADNMGSVGIAQWHSGRLDNLKKFAGNNWTNLDKQLDFVLHELNTTEKSAFNKLMQAKTVEEATESFMYEYERPSSNPSINRISDRIKEARNIIGAEPTEYTPEETSTYKPYISYLQENAGTIETAGKYSEPKEVTEAKKEIYQTQQEENFLEALSNLQQQPQQTAPQQEQSYLENPELFQLAQVPQIQYEQFQDGGVKEEDKKWLENWYNNRVIPDKEIQEDYLKDKPYFTQRIKEIPSVKNVDIIDNDPFRQGQYDGNKNTIEIIKTAEPSTYLHEANHSINSFPSYMRAVHENVVDKNIYKKGDPRLGVNNKIYDYLRDPDEIHSRVQVLRKDAGFRPDEEITEDRLYNYLQNYKGSDSNILQLMNLTDDNGLLDMLNYMAYNPKKNSAKENYAESGGVIKDNNGYWNPNNWGKTVEISSPNITMKGVGQPLVGYAPETGETKIMLPGEDYFFNGANRVIETPVFQLGGERLSWINPRNWGVDDYSDKGSFSNAYTEARKKGEQEFLFKGKRYNTNYKGTPQQQLRETGLTNSQIQDRSRLNKNLNDNIYPYSYEGLEKRIWKAGILGEKEENRKAIDKNPKNYDKEKLDALNLYSGVPQKNNTFRVSKYKPSKSGENVEYYTFNNQDDRFIQNLVDYAYSKSKTAIDGKGEGFDIGVKGTVADQEKNVMGNYKMSTGKDSRGSYVSFYDLWDLAPVDFGKPFEIYDRIYVKDYGDGKQKRMYYSDKELSQLDINKKNFDTLALQKELNNRGIKFEKSVNEDGQFDGIFGEETKRALLNYQSKNIKI